MTDCFDDYDDDSCIEETVSKEEVDATRIAHFIEDLHAILECVHATYRNNGINDDATRLKCPMMMARIRFVQSLLAGIRGELNSS